MDKIAVTVVVPVKNEEKNLPDCLKHLNEFSQVLVVDSGSSDNTQQIVKDFGAEYYNFIWNGKFPKKRNWVLRNLSIKNEWVLFLDADEIVTPVFKEELSEKINESSINGFWIRYRNYFMGSELKHGDTMSKLPLFRKDAGEYEKIEEDSWSHLDMEIHEHPVIKGKIGRIKASIIHNDYKGLEHYIAKHNAYSTWEAKRYLQLRKQDFPNLTIRQNLKYKFIRSGWLSLLYFTGAYFFKLGFLDGKAGYNLAKYKTYYFFQIKTKINEFERNSVV